MIAVAAHHGESSFGGLTRATGVRLGEMGEGGWAGCHQGSGPCPEANADADPAHPFYGQEMVFTGALASMTRRRRGIGSPRSAGALRRASRSTPTSS